MEYINRNGSDYEVVDARAYVSELSLRGANTVFERYRDHIGKE